MKKLNISQTDDGKLGEILDEILSKMGRGEEPDIDAYTRQHPEAGGILKHALPAIRAVADSIGGSDAAVDNRVSIRPEKALGDFRIVRELGRGGMGVVYEADQISLGRKVALKVLPFAGMIRENALQRFHNEVRAAAALDHPNIVSVYSIGEERGVHYYAMQLIQGRTLADVIAQLVVLRRNNTPVTGESLSHAICASDLSAESSATDPTEQHSQPPEKVPPPSTQRAIQANVDTLVTTGHDRQFYHSIAGLGIQAADALQHAHDNGVLHRDIKPGNLMLDAESQLYLTDFGLARIETDAAMTMTGDLIGTFRYMSPEQALAKRVVIDHRSDIYSLGATLYEAMTLMPVFVAEDRQELLKQIAFEEPTKLRKIDRSIPGELETIVHKAIAKNPDERYATAEELADDLRAFQRNRPIKAKPPTMLQRSGKWAQRHQGLVAAAIVVLLVTTMALGGSTWVVSQEQEQTEAALTDAKNNLEEAERQRQRAEGQRANADAERKRAEANFLRARDAVDRMFTRVAEDLADVPQMAHVRRALLEDALEFYQGFLEEKSDDPTIRHETAKAYWRVARIHNAIGQSDQAEQSVRQAIFILEKLSADFPANIDYRHDLASVYGTLANPILHYTRPTEAIEQRLKALAIRKQLVAEFPRGLSYRKELANSHTALGNTLRDCGKLQQAEVHLLQSLVVWEQLREDFPQLPVDRRGLAGAYQWFGALLYDTNRFVEAKEYYEKSACFREQLLAELPGDRKLKASLAHVKGYLANLARRNRNLHEAKRIYREAIALREGLSVEFPHSKEHRRRLGLLYRDFGQSLLIMGCRREAEDALRRGLKIHQELVARHPNEHQFAGQLAWNYYLLGCLLHDDNQVEPAADAFRQTLGLYEAMFAEFPENPILQESLAWFLVDCPAAQFRDPKRSVVLAKKALQRAAAKGSFWLTLGVAQYRSGDWSDAITALQKSDSLKPNEAVIWLFLAMAHSQLGQAEEAHRWYDKAIKRIEQIGAPDREVSVHLRETEQVLGLTRSQNDHSPSSTDDEP